MIHLRIVTLFIVCFVIASCGSKKNILYVQDIEKIELFDSSYLTYNLKVDDILKIDLVINDSEFMQVFNSQSLVSSNANRDNVLFNGYQIDTDGYISFPYLGKIKALGMTLNDLSLLIRQQLIDNGYLSDFTLNIKHINASFTALGEVNSPGKYDFLKNNLNLLEAIGQAGDLTINGVRNDIKVIREDFNGQRNVISIDLTSTDFLNNNFQIFSGDIIIVNPNLTRVKNSGIIGNSGTLLSLLSFLLSTIILVSN